MRVHLHVNRDVLVRPCLAPGHCSVLSKIHLQIFCSKQLFTGMCLGSVVPVTGANVGVQVSV